jgi:hypothetical protein
MSKQMHKLFTTACDLAEPRQVSAVDCQKCPRGSVVDNRSRVLCSGETKFYMTPCCYDMRSAATVDDCERCPYGEIGQDRLRVFCSRF